MLSDQNRPVIEATLPVVGEHIGEIAERFYGTSVRRAPRAARRHLQPRQPGQRRAAAGAGRIGGRVRQHAWSRPRSSVPEHLLSRIAHKHASLGIRPDQYQVVHDNLMWAIVDVLGDAVTPEVAAAWDEVYWLMANALINQERGLYSARGVRPETVWRDWQVEREDPGDRRRRHLRGQADRRPPGQDLAARPVRHGADADARRGAPAPPVQPHPRRRRRAPPVLGQARPRRRPARRRGVQRSCTTPSDVGDVLTMSLPYGDVVLDDAGRPVVFASAGIGITPMAGMLSHLVAAGSGLLDHPAARRRPTRAPFALRRQVVSDVLALPDASLHRLVRAAGAQQRTGHRRATPG